MPGIMTCRPGLYFSPSGNRCHAVTESNAIEKLLGLAGHPGELPDERAFKGAWHSLPETTGDFEAAVIGGAMSDRLAWVFLAAYQSAVRACFPGLPSREFVSFAASEDRRGEYPGTSIDDDGRLQGNKSWIAASRTVDWLLVTVQARDRIVLVNARADGVSLNHRDSPGFLGDMSQGMAAFVDVVPERHVSRHDVARFGLAEPFFVTAAAAGYLYHRESAAQHRDRILGVLCSLADQSAAGFHADVAGLLQNYDAVKSIGKAVGAAEGGADWSANGKLLGMYRSSLARQIGQVP